MLKVAVLASTRGTTFQGLLAKEIPGVEFVCLLSNKKDNFALERAAAADIPAHGGLTEKEIKKHLDYYTPDLIFMIGFMKILSEDFVNAFPHKLINVHPSLLPKFAGGMSGSVHQAVLDAGEKETGCTIHEVIAELDAGPILIQKTTSVFPGDNVDSLKERVQELEVEAFEEFLQKELRKQSQ